MIDVYGYGLKVNYYFFTESISDNAFLWLNDGWKRHFDYSSWADLYEAIKSYASEFFLVMRILMMIV